MTRVKIQVHVSMWSLLSVDQIFFSFPWNESKHLAGKEGAFFEIAKLFIEPLSSISISNSRRTKKIGKKRLSVNLHLWSKPLAGSASHKMECVFVSVCFKIHGIVPFYSSIFIMLLLLYPGIFIILLA